MEDPKRGRREGGRERKGDGGLQGATTSRAQGRGEWGREEKRARDGTARREMVRWHREDRERERERRGIRGTRS